MVIVVRTVGACLIVCSLFAPSLRAGDGGTWRKIATEEQMLRDPRQILTPGLFDQRRVVKVAFPSDGRPVDLPLPHEGNGADGKPRPPLRGALRQRTIWIDLDGNGKPGGKEVSGVSKVGETNLFSYPVSYADGTAGNYAFKLQATKTPGEFNIIRHCARVARIDKKQHTVVLIDDNGNGLYNDLGCDAILIDQQPVTFLGRQIYLNDKLYELLVHAGGTMIEIRPVAHYQAGSVDLFKAFEYPQKAQNLRIHTVIVQGKDCAFSFNPQQRVRPLPVGAYDMVFALLERSTERIYVLPGEQTSFQVAANQETTVKWGGPIKMRFTIGSDGRNITVQPPSFVGSAGEKYMPTDWQKIPCRATLSAIRRNPGRHMPEFRDVRSTLKFDFDKSGQLKPLDFEYRQNDVIIIGVTYKSGIMGTVHEEKRLNFVKAR